MDKRTDVWAFGAVAYEMLTGKQLFSGETLVETLACVMTKEPALDALPRNTPPAIRSLLRRCLERDQRQRLRDMGEARIVIQSVLSGAAAAEAVPAARGQRLFGWIATGAAAMLLLAPAGLAFIHFRGTPPPTPIRFSLPPPDGGSFFNSFETIGLAFSPDGSQLGFTASDRSGFSRVWIRSLASLDARPLAGTEGATSLFWSPDGRSIGFFADGKLKRLNLSDGIAGTVCDVPTGIGLFGTWGADGQILFAPIEGQAIFRVSISGGTPVRTVQPDPSRSETRVLWPWFLPDGRRFLYVLQFRNTEARLMLAESGIPPREVMEVGSNVQYVDPGYLVFAREGTLMGQRFDAVSGAVTGEPFAMAESVKIGRAHV
jgi:eukaryotic-like serine/threonine-protein kinase